MPGGPYYVIPKGGPFSFIEKAVKGVARGFVPGFAAVESVTKSLVNKKPRQGAVIQGPSVHTSGGSSLSLGQIQLPGGLGLHIPGLGPSSGTSSSGCPAGYHPAKDGSGRCVRNRRVNYANGRAAGRAATRLKGTVKQLSRYAGAIGKKVVAKGAGAPRRKK